MAELTKPAILFSDANILCVNKPAGLLSIPDGYHPDLPHLSQVLQPDFGKVWIVHRLDRDTSGAILLARSLAIHRLLNIQFEHRQVVKQYHAIIRGNPEWETEEIEHPLRINGDRRHRTVVAPLTGKPAKTSVRILKRFIGACLIEAQPHTGYTHQIRAHLAAIGSPILADPLYGTTKENRSSPSGLTVPDLIFRTALHSFSITFTHPQNQLLMTIEAPYPDDFRNAINALDIITKQTPC